MSKNDYYKFKFRFETKCWVSYVHVLYEVQRPQVLHHNEPVRLAPLLLLHFSHLSSIFEEFLVVVVDQCLVMSFYLCSVIDLVLADVGF